MKKITWQVPLATFSTRDEGSEAFKRLNSSPVRPSMPGSWATSRPPPPRGCASSARSRASIVGSILNVKWHSYDLATWDKVLTAVQDVATKETRLGVPILYGIDAIHGANYTQNATLFPHNIGMAASRDRSLVKAGAPKVGLQYLLYSLQQKELYQGKGNINLINEYYKYDVLEQQTKKR